MGRAFQWVQRIAFIAGGFGIPGFALGDAIESGHIARWVAIALAGITPVLALAYTGVRKQLKACKMAMVRIQAKQDAGIKYIIYPPEDGTDERTTEGNT